MIEPTARRRGNDEPLCTHAPAAARADAARPNAAPAHVARSPLARAAWLSLGWLFVALGSLGAALPLLPTTPFLLLAGYCFTRSSPRLDAWLLANPTYGPLLADWRAGRGLPRRVKVVAVTTLVLSITVSGTLFVASPYVRALLAAIALCVSAYLLSIPTKRPEAGPHHSARDST